MAEDFIELGIEGIDKLVDKHFHKVPDKYVDPHTYHVHRRRHRRRSEDGESADSERDVANEPMQEERYQRQRIGRNEEGERVPSDSENAYGPRQEEPYQRLRMTSDANGYGYDYFPQSQGMPGPYMQGGQIRQRPEGLLRRSSSQPGAVGDGGREKEREQRRRRRSLSDDRGSPRGKLRSSRGNRNAKGQNKPDKVALTLLGLAAGGFVASGVMSVIAKRNSRRETGDEKGEDERQRNSKRDTAQKERPNEREGSSGGRHVPRAERTRGKGGGKGGGRR
jgi:hypothetical protein